MHSDEEASLYEKEFRRLMDSIDRYEAADPDEIEPDEYQRILARYEELRRAGYGPQPHHLDK